MNLRSLWQRIAGAGSMLCFALLYAGDRAIADVPRETDEIAWRIDYASALEEARAANRLLWIQFTGPWCPNCTRMERDSFPHPVIVQHARESFVPLKLQSDVHEQLAQNFNLSGLPATIIVAPDRSVVAIHQGYLGPVEFDAFLREGLSRLPANLGSSTARAAQDRDPAIAAGNVGSKSAERLALDGYCAVSLIRDRKLVAGQNQYSIIHDGKTYRFASRESRNLFRAEPDRYVPANDGACPVTQLERGKVLPGNPQWGILYNRHLFLFATEDARRQFVKEPDRYTMIDVAEQGFCMHCIRESGLLVRGDPRHEVARAGRRYWFPDSTHRDAFIVSLR